MSRYLESLIAATGIFAGSLLWDMFFGDGIQDEDYFEALSMAIIAAAIQWVLSQLRQQHPT